MNYMQTVDAWLEQLGITNPETKRAIKEKILESYRNGQRDRAGRFNGKQNKPRAHRQYAYGTHHR
jgi:hypothetical protein